MPGSAHIVLPLLDVLSGKSSGDAYIVLPALQVSGSVYEHSEGALTLPMVTVNFTMSVDNRWAVRRALPRLQAKGRFGATATLTLPALVVAGHVTVPLWWSAEFTLPALTAKGAGIGGAVASAHLTLPRMFASMRLGGGRGKAVLPRLLVHGSFSSVGQGTGRVVLPALRASGTFLAVVGEAWRGAVELPALVAGPYARAHLVLPMLLVHGGASFESDPALAGAFEGWLLNTRNGATTRITNFPFTHFTSVGNKTYAVGPNGLYLLGGEKDNGVPIKWKFETGLDDLGKPGVKHIPYLYLDGIIDGVIQIALIDDRNRVFAYEYSTKARGAVHLPHRRKLGNGIRTRSMAFRISSDSGAYIELDSLEPQITVTQRSI